MADDRSSKKDIDAFAKKAGDKSEPKWRKLWDDHGWAIAAVALVVLAFVFWTPLNKALDDSGISSKLGLSTTETATDPEIAAKEKELADLKAKKAGNKWLPPTGQTGGNEQEQGASEKDVPRAPTAAELAAEGQARCDNFGKGMVFVRWLNYEEGQARCRKLDGLAALAAQGDSQGMPHPTPAVTGSNDPAGQQRCNEIHPGSVFIAWKDREHGVATCGRRK
jgi:hypothetical protein